MARFGSVALALLCAPALGCALVASPVGNGLLYTNVRGPITVGTDAAPTTTGTACAQNYLGFVATGDASIDTAKKSGRIANVSSVDHSSFSVLGFYSSFCTIVAGR